MILAYSSGRSLPTATLLWFEALGWACLGGEISYCRLALILQDPILVSFKQSCRLIFISYSSQFHAAYHRDLRTLGDFRDVYRTCPRPDFLS